MCVVAFGACVLVNTLALGGLVASGRGPGEALDQMTYGSSRAFLHSPDVDSWWPMAVAFQRIQEQPDGDVYDVFRVDHIKFQYPPTSLLVMLLFPRKDVADLARVGGSELEGHPNSIVTWVGLGSRLAVLITILLSASLLLTHCRRAAREARPWERPAVVLASVCALGLTYYPLLHGSVLGQVQVFLGMLMAASLWLEQRGWRTLSGVCACIACSMKPQYGLLILWALTVRRYRFAAGFVGTGVVILVLSVGAFGWHNHLNYLSVMGELSRSGEAFWPNQSVNGLMNRLLGNGSAIQWERHGFPPYHPVVYAVTLVTSVAFIAVAMWGTYRQRQQATQTTTMALTLMAATMASPIAWEHHYGSFFAVFCATAAPLVTGVPWGRRTLPLLLLSYLLMANVVTTVEPLFGNRWTGLLGSHLFFGALILFCQVATLVLKRNDQGRAGLAEP